MNDYYVYVYIDPRNFEEFYYGKGRGSRKDDHIDDTSDTDKVRRISAIKREGLLPIIRVIARNLTENEAFLIEKTLLWKLGKWTTNISSGYFSDNFRPHDTLHKELSGFDFQNGFYYYNVGEGPHRRWTDYMKYGFISAGQGVRWRDAMLGFNTGDVIAAYLKKHGFVGIGRIEKTAMMIRDVHIDGMPLLSLPLECDNMHDNCDSKDLSEYVCIVGWIKKVDKKDAKWRKSPILYTTTHVRASLENQPETVSFLEEEFDIKIRELIV